MSDPLNLLLVDDSPTDRAIYQRFLSQDDRHSYRVTEFEKGKDALAWCQHNTPDMILLDYGLPDLDGLEFLKALRRQHDKAVLPVVILTAYGDATVVVEAMNHGAQNYLDKNRITSESLSQCVHHVLTQTQLKQDLVWQQEQQRLVAATTLQIRQSLKLNDILETAVREIRTLLQADRVLAYRFNPDWSGQIVVESVEPGWTAMIEEVIDDPCFKNNWVQPYLQGRVSSIENIHTANIQPCYRELLAQFQIQANLVVPLISEGTLWGLLIAHHCASPHLWQPREIELMQQLATQLAIAIEQAELHDNLRQELIKRQQTEIAFQAIFEQSPEGKIRFALDGSFIAANCAWEEIWQTSAETLVGYNILHDPVVVQNGNLAAVLRAFAGEVTHFPPGFHDPSQFKRSGRSRWIDMLMYPIKNPAGQILEVVLVIRDISDRIIAEQKQQRLVRLVENSPNLIGTATLDGQVTFVNPAGQALVGLEANQIAQTNISEYQPPAATDQFRTQILPKVLSTGQWQGEIEICHLQTDERIPVWCDAFTLISPQTGQPEEIAIIMQDLREQKRTEALLQQQAELLELAYDAVVARDVSGKIIFWNQGAESLYGWTKAQAIGEEIHTLFQTVFPISYEATHTALLEQGYWEGETTHTRQDGQRIVTESRHSLIRDAHGQPNVILEINRNITDRKRIEQSLRESEEKLRLFVKHAPVRIAMLDCEMRYITASQWWIDDFCIDAIEELVGQHHYDVFPEIPEHWRQTHQRCLAGATERYEEDLLVRLDGSQQWVKREIRPWYRSDNTIGGIIIFSENITERKQAQCNEQFLQQLDLRLRQLSDAKAMQWEVVSSLGEYLNLDRCLWCEIDAENRMTIIDQDWRQSDLPSHTGTYSLTSFISSELQAAHAAGQPVVIADILTDPSTTATASTYQQLNIGALVAVPCTHAGRWIAALAANTRTARHWRDDEIALMQEVVGRLWSIIEQTRSVELLRESEEKFRQLAENINDVFWISQPEISGVLYINPAYEKIWGRSCDSLYANPRSFVDAIHPDDREEFLASGVARATQIYQNEYRVVRPDGSISWVMDKSFPVRNEAGEIYRCCGIVQDITNLKSVFVNKYCEGIEGYQSEDVSGNQRCMR